MTIPYNYVQKQLYFLVVVVCLGTATNVYISRAYQLGFINSETVILIYKLYVEGETSWDENVESLSHKEKSDLILAYQYIKTVSHGGV